MFCARQRRKTVFNGFYALSKTAETLSPDISHGSEGRDAALRRPRAVQARNVRFTERPIRGPVARRVPPLNAAGTAQRAIPTFVSSLAAETVMRYPG